MKDYISQHYKQRFKDIFSYSNRKWWYVLLKTLCIAVGFPIYLALIPLDFVVFFVYALFSWVPYLSTLTLFLCRILTIICGIGYYVCILPDAKHYIDEDKERYQAEQAEYEKQLQDEQSDAKEQQQDKEVQDKDNDDVSGVDIQSDDSEAKK